MKTEIVCITRTGFEFLATEGAEFAAKVTELEYEPGRVFVPAEGIKNELLIPRFPPFNGWS